MFREIFAFYSPVYAGPDGNYSRCFHTADSDSPPVIDGVTIPESGYNTRKEVEIDLAMTNVKQFKGILGKFCMESDFSKYKNFNGWK